MTSSWTEMDMNLLRELKTDGWSAGQMVSRFVGKTRNAIIGKLHRLGLGAGTIKKPSVKRPQKHERMWRASIRRQKLDAYVAPEKIISNGETPKHLKLIELTNESCHWPYGDGPFTFCGCQRALFSDSYCEYHHRISHVRQEKTGGYFYDSGNARRRSLR